MYTKHTHGVNLYSYTVRTRLTSIGINVYYLLEGVNNKFFKVNFKKYILFKNGCFKAVKLVKKVILVINGVSTIYLWTKHEEKRHIL